MPRVSLRNLKVHYQQIGSGPDIVLIHGMSCHIAFWWFHIAPQLAKTHRVTAVDLRGHGFTSMTDYGYRPCDLAKDVIALIEHLGIDETKLLGHSFGGAVASAVATERPDLVSELILADAWLPSLQPVPPLLSERDWTSSLARARTHGIVVEPNLPLVMRGLLKEVIDEHELQSQDGHHEPETSKEPTWEESGWSRGRIGFLSRGSGGTRSGRGFWPTFNARYRWRGRMSPQAEAAAEKPDAKEASAAAQSPLEGALQMTVKPGEPSLALRRWTELMRRTDARAEYLDTTGIDADALAEIPAEVRLVYGARSQYRTSAVKLKELLPNARLRIVPRSGHYFPLLRPKGLLDALELQAPDARDKEQAAPKRRLRLVASGGKKTADPDTQESVGSEEYTSEALKA